VVLPLAKEDLFDPEFFQRLQVLSLRLKKHRQMQRRGAQSSPATGQTREFKDYRHYSSGEDYRAIDWRLYARLDRLFVRLFEETQELHLHLLIDTSASMAVPHVQKRLQALRLAAALAYLGLSNQQHVSLYALGAGLWPVLPPLRSLGALEQLSQLLCQLSFAGVADLEKCFAEFRPPRLQQGLIFVISDFYGSAVGTAATAFQHSSSWPGETHLVQVMHSAERAPAALGQVQLEEVETQEQRSFSLTKADLQRYQQLYDTFLQDLRSAAASRNLQWNQLQADQPFDEQCLAIVMKSAGLA
jgi:uncharacterized protein (DUF58 family)